MERTKLSNDEMIKQLSQDSEKLLLSALLLNLSKTIEERIEAHENSRQLMMELQKAGKELNATKP